jgi:hypothetical protein
MVKPGDRVILSFVPNCGHCHFCESGHPHLCDEHARTTGKLYDGTSRLDTQSGQDCTHMGKVACFAEYAVVPEVGCILAPPSLDFPQMALIGCSVTTGVGAAVFNAQVRPGQSVAVIGCGGVGLNVLQGARLAGATTIIAVDVKDAALTFAKKFGATHTVNARTEDAVAAVQALPWRRPLCVEAWRGSQHRCRRHALRSRDAASARIARFRTRPRSAQFLTRRKKTIAGVLAPHPRRTCRASPTGTRAGCRTSTAWSPAAIPPGRDQPGRGHRNRRGRPRRFIVLAVERGGPMPVTLNPRVLAAPRSTISASPRQAARQVPGLYRVGGIVRTHADGPALRRPRHRGHGPWTQPPSSTEIYDLEAHLDLPYPAVSRLTLPCAGDARIVVSTTAASGKRDGSIRYWIRRGPEAWACRHRGCRTRLLRHDLRGRLR